MFLISTGLLLYLSFTFIILSTLIHQKVTGYNQDFHKITVYLHFPA